MLNSKLARTESSGERSDSLFFFFDFWGGGWVFCVLLFLEYFVGGRTCLFNIPPASIALRLGCWLVRVTLVSDAE